MVKGGVVSIEMVPPFADSVTSSEGYIYDGTNGDDWFCIKATAARNQSANPDEHPIMVSSMSSSDTTLIRFKYDQTPEHKVLHEGWCNFAGLKPVVENTEDEDLALAGLSVRGL